MEIDKDTIFKKWEPIIRSLNINDDERISMLSKFAEMYVTEESKKKESTEIQLSNILLPYTIKIIPHTIL